MLHVQSSTELSMEKQFQLAYLLQAYGSMFSTGHDDLGFTNLAQHDIVTYSGVPVKQELQQMAWQKQPHADQQRQQSLEAGLACCSYSS